MKNLSGLGEALAAARDRAGLTQAQLGEMVGATNATISRIERGGNTTLEMLDSILGALGTDLFNMLQRGPARAGAESALGLLLRSSSLRPGQLSELSKRVDRLAQDVAALKAKEEERSKRPPQQTMLEALDGLPAGEAIELLEQAASRVLRSE